MPTETASRLIVASLFVIMLVVVFAVIYFVVQDTGDRAGANSLRAEQCARVGERYGISPENKVDIMLDCMENNR